MSKSRLSPGESDPITYTCTCSASSLGGTVLLFYRYWQNAPPLPTSLSAHTADLEALVSWHRALTTSLHLTGKIRLAPEGFNITIAGTRPEIESYITHCVSHWSFAGLLLDTPSAQSKFFKPSPGCACVFPGGVASVRITPEITPMGIQSYSPADWSCIRTLVPAEFHWRCHEENVLLLDVRNVYESRIGYFIDPHTGDPALRPPIRRFSQWPQYVARRLGRVMDGQGKQVDQEWTREKRVLMTYCTGGIRCEKATRWMWERTQGLGQNERREICTLEGGITAYLVWIGEEIRCGRKGVEQSLFKGRNYVFDARGSMGLEVEGKGKGQPVAKCHVCEMPADGLGKCRVKGCHLVLVICEGCQEKDLRCCESCGEGDKYESSRRMCRCEREREEELWGEQKHGETRTLVEVRS